VLGRLERACDRGGQRVEARTHERTHAHQRRDARTKKNGDPRKAPVVPVMAPAPIFSGISARPVAPVLSVIRQTGIRTAQHTRTHACEVRPHTSSRYRTRLRSPTTRAHCTGCMHGNHTSARKPAQRCLCTWVPSEANSIHHHLQPSSNHLHRHVRSRSLGPHQTAHPQRCQHSLGPT
jgi:hypothetical protein